ncbi:hypothetical protein B5C34_10445 [Pacificimonas flava]|uniref:Uncharacterized protein n=2 Tax=Pacificimonas TaxID=1960290 RepID=A0A219B6V0_9SPHN|nr:MULTISPECIES: hypothetical protein [Pacificimonas]MBZ6378912.1 hypothetical protein [Pacificimonas aurantium]OWV33836.1 hypothetical protein B5C34_10445 [Pacificimonas flava]
MTGHLRTFGLGVTALSTAMAMYVSGTIVSAEREQIEDLRVSIAADRDEMEELTAELGVRSSLARLERMNEKYWSLRAPQVGQIVRGDRELARLLQPRREQESSDDLLLASYEPAAPGSASVQLAASVEPAAPAQPKLMPAVVRADRTETPVPLAATSDEGAAVSAPKPLQVAYRQPVHEPARPDVDLFSDSFMADIDTAAALERASYGPAVQ